MWSFINIAFLYTFTECGPSETFCPEGYKFYPELCFCLKYFSTKRKPDVTDLDCQADGAMHSKNVNGKAAVVRIDSQAKQKRVEDYLQLGTWTRKHSSIKFIIQGSEKVYMI